MNAILAKNVRLCRDLKHWTQQHLADAAGILLRTVQRVEEGKGGSAETLSALAGAFNIGIEHLQADYEALIEQAKKEDEEVRKTHNIIEITPVSSSSDFNVIGGKQGIFDHCFSDDDAVQDAFAGLKQNVMDCLEIWDDVPAPGQREFVVSLFEQTKKFEKLGMVVGTGSRSGTWHGMKVTSLYLVAMPKDDVRPYIRELKGSTDVKDAI